MSGAWRSLVQRAWFGTTRSPVQIWAPRPTDYLPVMHSPGAASSSPRLPGLPAVRQVHVSFPWHSLPCTMVPRDGTPGVHPLVSTREGVVSGNERRSERGQDYRIES